MGDHAHHHEVNHGNHHNYEHQNHDVESTTQQIFTDAVQMIQDSHANHNANGHEQHVGDHSAGHMSMTFHGGCKETILFDWWVTDSVGGLIGSIIAIFVIAVLYEGLKYYRDQLFWKTCNSLQYRAVQPPEEKASQADEPRVVQPSMCSKFHIWQTALHAIQVSISYLLMLIFMTFNTWLCLAVVAGAACGNFLFGWKKSVVVDVTEHCH